MRFSVLGTIQVTVNGTVRQIVGPKQRNLLALLLLEAPRPLTVGRLLDELWGDGPPPRALAALRVHVSALRRSIPGRLRTLPGAYVLDAGDEEIDARRFAALAARGQALRDEDPAGAADILDEALALWRGDAFADVSPAPGVFAAAARLEELRLTALEDRAGAMLALGRHEELVAELTGLVREHGMRERLVGLLMLALHRSGRSGDALLVYEDLCATLDRQLGVDPGDELVALEKAIRRGDVAVPTASQGRPARLRIRSPQPAAPLMPRGQFVHRPRLLRRLMGRFERRATVLVAGPGFGKTSLMVQAYRDNALHPRGIDLWLSCQPSHEAASVLGAALCELMQAPDLFDAEIAETVRTVTDIIWAQAPVEVSLVLDDVHHLPAASPGVRLLAALLDALPVNGHLMLASRTPPPVPLARLAALGQAAWLEEEDLRFSDDELADFAALRSVPIESLEATRGWPALAELAALAGGTGAIQRSLVEDYLWEEVLGTLTPERRRDLGLLAGLGELDRELAAAVVGRDVDLEELMAGLPLVNRAGDRCRMHVLLERALARDLPAGSRPGARLRASGVLLRRGRLVEAMRLVAQEAHWPGMRTVIREAAAGGRAPLTPEVLESWLPALPAAAQGAPEALLLRAMVAADRRPRTADRQFEAAIAAYRAIGDAEGELAALRQRHILAWLEGNQATLAKVVGRAFELAGQGIRQADVQAAHGRAMVAFMVGNWNGILAAIDAIREEAMPKQFAATSSYLCTLAHIGLGDVASALDVAERAMALGDHRHRVFAMEGLGFARTMAGDLRGAVSGMPEHGAEAYRLGWPNGIVSYHAGAAILEAATGDLVAAAEHLARAEAFEPDQLSTMARMWLRFAHAHRALEAGDEEQAAALLRAELAERPIGSPLTHMIHLGNLARLYVLLPESRPSLDSLDLPSFWSRGRAMGRALVALRERADTRPGIGLWPLRPEHLRLHLPIRWAAELAVAASRDAAGAQRAIEELGDDYAAMLPVLAGSRPPALAARARRVLARIPPVPPHGIEVRLLGPPVLLRAGIPVDHPDWSRRPEVRALLAYLAAQGAAGRAELVAALWPGVDGEAGRRLLRSTLVRLQRVLEPGRKRRHPAFFVRPEGDRLRLAASDHLEVDAWLVQRRLDEAEGADSPGAALDAYLAALERWRGRYLDELPGGGWAADPRGRLEERLVGAAIRAGELLLARNGADQALALATRALEVAPYREAAFRLQAAAHLALGDRTAMRRTLQRCRQALSNLGAAPQPETEMLERVGA